MGGFLIKRSIAIIPARGGSKRLPRKNIRSFLGRPIIHYTIEAAQQSGLFDKVVVSTEDAEIKNCVDGMGCDIHHRSPELATDTATVIDVLKAVLNHYGKIDREFDYLCCLYPTAPLRDAHDIQNAYHLMLSKQADYCQAVTDYYYSPFFAFNLKEDGRIEKRWPELAKLPSLEKPKVVVDNGSMYWAKVTSFLQEGELESNNTVGYIMPVQKSVDIDTEDDFRLAEHYAKTLSQLHGK